MIETSFKSTPWLSGSGLPKWLKPLFRFVEIYLAHGLNRGLNKVLAILNHFNGLNSLVSSSKSVAGEFDEYMLWMYRLQIVYTSFQSHFLGHLLA